MTGKVRGYRSRKFPGGGLSSQIQKAFDKIKSEIAHKNVPGNLSDNMNLVCEFMVKQQLKSMLPELFQKSNPNKPPFVVMEDNEAVIKICFK